MTETALRVCGSCVFFVEIDTPIPMAVDVATSEEVPPGRRSCSAHNIAWADSPCTTGEFQPKGQIVKSQIIEG